MMATVSPSPLLPPKLLDYTYLSNSPSDNLEKLSSPKYSSTPPTGCMTREVYKKVPFFKPTQSSIQSKCFRIGFKIPMAYLLYRLVNGAIAHGISKGDEWQTNFFPVASECLGKSISDLGEPSAQIITYASFVSAALFTLGLYTSSRLFFTDYSEKSRFALLDQEYSAIHQILIGEFDKARKENDPEALKKMIGIASRLRANLPKIENDLKEGVRLDPDDLDHLMLKLTHGIDYVLKTDTPTLTQPNEKAVP